MATTDIAAKYSPSMSRFYDKIVADAVLTAVSPLVSRVRNAVVDGSFVLEIGCGGGQFALALIEQHPGISVTGVDLSAEQVARATARAKALPSKDSQRVRFQMASASDIPFPEGSFESVVSIASIKHWPERDKGINEMVRVLKNGGLLLIAEVDRGCHLDDARRFVRDVHLPAPMRLPYLWMFRTYVAGQGLDLDEARTAIAGQPLVDAAVHRIPGTPFLLMSGAKRDTATI